jgi:SulP family sulfate permease
MAALAGILVIVAYNMSEWKSFAALIKGPRSDVAVLLTTFLLTVFIDLTIAIEIGMVLAVFLFMRKMIQFSDVSLLTKSNTGAEQDREAISNYEIPAGVEVFEITGPLFFGAAYKFREAMRLIEKPPQVLIIRMRQVPLIDATGIRTIEDVYREAKKKHTRVILTEVRSARVMEELKDARLLFAIGKSNVTATFEEGLRRSRVLLSEQKPAV